MTKKAKKRRFDESESNNEEQNVTNTKKVDDSPKKKKKVSDNLPNAKEKEQKVSKDLQETNLLVHKSKKKKNKKHKKHDKLNGTESDVSQSESKKKKKNKKDKKPEKNNSIERKIKDSEDTSKSKQKHTKINATEINDQCKTSVSKKHEKIEAVILTNEDGEAINKLKKKPDDIEAVQTRNHDVESTSKSKKKKKNKRHKKHKQADKSDEKLESNSEKLDNKAVTKVEKVISTKRKTKFKLKREEFRKQRKLIRQEEGQFSSINKLSLEEMKQKIAEIESRESLSNSALRKLRTLKKKVQVEEGTADNVKTEKRKNDELDDHTDDHKNKKMKKELLLNTTKIIDSPSKNKKEVTPKKSKSVEHNLTDQITSKQLFIEDRVGSTANEDRQEKLQLKQTKKELFVEDKIGIPLPKSRIDSPRKKHEKLEIIKPKNKIDIEKNLDFENGSFDDSHQIPVLDNVDTKVVDLKQNKSPELKKINKKKLKGETIVNLGKDLEESDSKIDFNKESNQISLKKQMKQVSKKASPKNLIHQKSNKNKFEHKISDKEDGELEDDSDDSKYSKSNSICLKKEIKANNKSPKHLLIQNKKKKIVKQKISDMEEGELTESDSEDSISYETSDISLKKEIRANAKKLSRNLKAEKNMKKFEQKHSDVEEGELEENDSEERDAEDSDSADSTYNNGTDDIAMKKEQIINKKKSPQNLKNPKEENKKFEPKSDKEEGELEEGDEAKRQSDNTLSNHQVEHGSKQKENHNANSAKKQRYVLFLGNLAYETTTVDLKKHFLTKVDKVKDVRIPLDAKTRKPRGFGYIEVENSEDYEKALSLHGTFVKGRPIKVQYTASGSKKAGNRKEIIHKNKKLHALRKAGKLAGSKKDSHKRSFRRNFKKERTQK